MKKFVLFLNLMMLAVVVAFAQPQYAINTPLSTAFSVTEPFNSSATNNKVQMLYLASELPGVPNGVYISKIYFKGRSNATNATYTDFKVSIGQITQNSFSSTSYVTTGMQVVVPTTLYVIPTVTSGIAAWFEIPLITPFLLDNTKNYVIEVEHNGLANGFDLWSGSGVTGTNRRIVGNFGATSGTHDARRPDFGFDILRPCENIKNLTVTNITRDSAYVSWNPHGPNASAFEWVLNQDPNNPGLTAGFQTTPNPFLQLTKLKAGTCYYIHIRTNCNPATSIKDTAGWETTTFCTQPDCLTPTVTIENVTGTTAIARWDAVPGAFGYEYSVGTEPNPPLGSGSHTTYTNVKLWGLTPNKTLYFYVRAKCTPIPLSNWGTTPFHTTVGTSVNDITAGAALQVYPNPVSDVLNVQFANMPAAGATLQLLDMTGKLIQQQPATSEKAEINMSNIPAGLYMLKYATAEGAELIKISKQ